MKEGQTGKGELSKELKAQYDELKIHVNKKK